MDEANLKETLSRFSEKRYTPSFSNEISGWVDEFKAHKFAKPPKKNLTTLLTSKKHYAKKQKLQVPYIKKPLSLFQFHSITQNGVKHKHNPKKIVKHLKRPASSINKSKPNCSKRKYSSIVLNKTVVFDSLTSYNRNFSPSRTTGVNVFRRSSSSMDSTTPDVGLALAIHGSSCYIKPL